MANVNTKVTKKDYFNALYETVKTLDSVGDYTVGEVLEFINKQIAQLNAKANKAKEKAEEKKLDGDELRSTVLSVITNEFQTADEITEAIGEEDVTKSKVVARLTQLVKFGDIVKEEVKTDAGKRMAYKLAETDETE